ncbi:hypothetical protein AGIG_G6364 [Arapaima gigas]
MRPADTKMRAAAGAWRTWKWSQLQRGWGGFSCPSRSPPAPSAEVKAQMHLVEETGHKGASFKGWGCR